jgi:putative heme iron utilization protein
MEMAADSATSAALARSLMRDVRTAALATLEESGGPFASYVAVAPGADGAPILLLSGLAVHSRNLQRDQRGSLLLVREPPEPTETMTALRLTLTGRVVQDENPHSIRRFLACHPDAARYSSFADFSVYRFSIAAGHLVAGFGQIVSLTPGDLLGKDM